MVLSVWLQHTYPKPLSTRERSKSWNHVFYDGFVSWSWDQGYCSTRALNHCICNGFGSHERSKSRIIAKHNVYVGALNTHWTHTHATISFAMVLKVCWTHHSWNHVFHNGFRVRDATRDLATYKSMVFVMVLIIRIETHRVYYGIWTCAKMSSASKSEIIAFLRLWASAIGPRAKPSVL